MKNKTTKYKTIEQLDELVEFVEYSFVESLQCDRDAREDAHEYESREVLSGHYVRVNPTPIENPTYITHSKRFFEELGFAESLATSLEFMRLFSGDTSQLPEGLSKSGWATGYALSIYGTEYYQQCPFGTGNGYGDGRAVSILEVVLKGKRWEMQLKGGGRTPYCRGADGRAVLRSSIREFLAQEHMHALNIPTSRSLTLYGSQTERVRRPWFFNGSYSRDPEVMIEEAVAITTRVAPSFIRVGQIELFGRRERKKEHPESLQELQQIVLHLIEREYSEIDEHLPLEQKVLELARAFRERLTSLVADWIRVGFCQGNFNSDNCAAGGYTLDYGPFGFMDMFEPRYQPWTGGGEHYSFLNQPQAAEKNYSMFTKALEQLLKSDANALEELKKIEDDFARVMQIKMIDMWSAKLGVENLNVALLNDLIRLMVDTSVDYTIFFRELSCIPDNIAPLKKSFYGNAHNDENLLLAWAEWLERWRKEINASESESRDRVSQKMKKVNPKYTLREWFLVPAYEAAQEGDYRLIKELQEVMGNPYDEQSDEIEQKYYRKKPQELFRVAGISHVSCSS